MKDRLVLKRKGPFQILRNIRWRAIVTMMIKVFLFMAWFLSGLISYVYWWTKDFDLTVEDFVLGIFLSWLGPLNFPIGALVHWKGSARVLIKKR